MDKRKFDEIQTTILNTQRDLASQNRTGSWDTLTPQEKLAKWKSITTDQFDALPEDQQQALLKEWNDLVDAVGETPDDKVGSLEQLRAKLKQVKSIPLDLLREIASRNRGTDDPK